MRTIRKTITLTEQQDAWITAQIEAGQYTNDSEAIRDLVHKEQARVAQVGALRQALIEGENSGEPVPFDVAIFRQRLCAGHG